MNHTELSYSKHLFELLSRVVPNQHHDWFKQVVDALADALLAGHSCVRIADLNIDSHWRTDLKTLITLADAPIKAAPQNAPIIQFDEKLYFSRSFHAEATIARHILRLFSDRNNTIKLSKNREEQLFDTDPSAASYSQYQAAIQALNSPFCTITGGPGTGKTTTVLRILAALCEAYNDSGLPTPNIVLLAPTGKAAARLGESILSNKLSLSELGVSERIIEAIPSEAKTLHRALRWHPNGFHHNAYNPMPGEIFIIDEASMIDITMMSALTEALPDGARVILLGDPYQLASVEAGSVLADLVAAARNINYFNPMLAELNYSFRFASGSGIGQLASAINVGDAATALDILKQNPEQDLNYQNDGEIGSLDRGFHRYLEAIANQHAAIDILQDFKQWRVLCALREGDYGVVGLNQKIEHQLAAKQKIDRQSVFYNGRPVMILNNDYQQQLFNGDIGITIWEKGLPMVYFEAENNSVKKVLATRLPECETAFAMTIHKSQGSEFERCAVVLPAQVPRGDLIGRELLYTGITRAKQALTLIASDDILIKAIRTPIARTSGLVAHLAQNINNH